jgi:glycosyltransferase involved in cell wall biosynthesis
VVIPTHDRGALVVRAVEAALAQTAGDLEVVVVDDRSSDDTPARLAALAVRDPRVRPLRLASGGRPAIARNAGVRASRGRLVAFCDDDDVWYPQKLELQLRHLEERPGCAFVSARCRWVGAEERVWPALDAIDPTYANLVAGNFVPCSMTVVRREVLDRHGLFDEAPELTVGEDWDLWLRIARHHAFRVLPDVLGDYLVHAGGASRRRLDELRGVLTVLERLRARDRAAGRLAARRIDELRRELSRELWRAGQRPRALRVRLGG